MSTTPHLGLPLIAAAQAQKHVTHNEALYALDALVQCAVLDKDLSAPPPTPAEGAVYIVGAAPTGDWTDKADKIVLHQDGAWLMITPQIGFLAYVVDEALLYVFTSSGWTALTNALTAIQNLARLGIGTMADATNPFSAKLNKALWTARGTGEGGTGDLRYTLSKQAAGNVLSLLFQTGFSGRCEIGLVGSDNLVAKVSPDGTTWREAVAVDSGTGSLDFLSMETSLASAATVDLGSVRTRRVVVTGSTTITGFGTGSNRERILRFASALTLTHNATNLVLPGGQNISTAAGDTALAVSDATGNWRVAHYQRANNRPTVDGIVSTGMIFCQNAAGNVLTNGQAVIDGVTQANRILFYENGSPYRGVSVDISQCGSQSSMWISHKTNTPGPDNTYALGSGASRFTQLFAASGTINTSDARTKTVIAELTEAELGWAADLARETGSFQYLDAIAAKGDDARRHIGLTVQRAIELGQARGLDPFRYAFICHDSWEAEPGADAIEGRESVLDAEGSVIDPGCPGSATVSSRPAGDLYGLRPDQLALFIARGQEARLSALEARFV